MNYVLDHDGWTLVHGVIRIGKTETIFHAWAEKGRVVWEGQLDASRFWYHAEWYRYVVKVDARYTRQQALNRFESTSTTGPWGMSP